MRYKKTLLVNKYMYSTLILQEELGRLFLDSINITSNLRHICSISISEWTFIKNPIIIKLNDHKDLLGKYYIFDYDKINKDDKYLSYIG